MIVGKPMIIAVDFDGTCVTHEYPKIGKEIGAAPVLKWLTDNGHKIILHTMRGKLDNGKGDLDDALWWFKEHDIPLFGVNENPTQISWTQSPKPYAQLYIDDAALGCPLMLNPALSDRPFVNWARIKTELEGIFESGFVIGFTDLIGVENGSHNSARFDNSN